MRVLVVSSVERECFTGRLIECLIYSRSMRKNTRFCVVVESDKGKRLTMAEQDKIIARLKI